MTSHAAQNWACHSPAAGQLFMLKVSKQPKWYALPCSLSFTVTLMRLPGEKGSVWLVPHASLPARSTCSARYLRRHAAAFWSAAPATAWCEGAGPLCGETGVVPALG